MAANSSSNTSLHVFFIPFLSRGHTIPLVDIARLFAQRGGGIRCTVVTTPGNSSYIHDTIQSTTGLHLELVPFPAAEVGLPVGIECTDALPPASDNKDYGYANLYKGMTLLQHPIEKLIVDRRPDCIVADLLLVWTAETARTHSSIPFFHFSALSPFSIAVIENAFTSGALQRFSGSEAVGPLPGLPHTLELIRSDLPTSFPVPDMFEKRREVERNSCGMMFNTFEELMPEYVEHCRKVTLTGDPINVWCVGPVHLYKGAIDQDGGKISNWLDSKPSESVLYVSFGSECFFSSEQLKEIAIGLQSCRHSFIWVVRGAGGGADTINEWLPLQFYETVGDRGLILTKWSPQVAILNHRAMGGYIMHCGWNSCMETVCAGLPVIAWPLHSDHFVSERLVVEVIKTGLRILDGPELRSRDTTSGKGIVKGEAIRAAVDRLMGGEDEEAKEIRNNAKKYKEMAKSAMEEGGSSYGNLSSVIEMMKVLVKVKKQ